MAKDWGSTWYVAMQFQRWYKNNAKIVKTPNEAPKREFAFISFGGKTMFRHISFKSDLALQNYLRNNAPAHSYHSSAYYLHPERVMVEKGWLGADLVFDIDSDHFHLPCQQKHDQWWCLNCDELGMGHPPEKCKCGKANFETKNWLCESCLQAAKHEAQKLLDILIQDFGLSQRNELILNFSGNRGYHVHVRSPKVKELGQHQRREIVDYILALGFEPDFQGFQRLARSSPSTLAEIGWRGRSVRALYDYISETSNEKIKILNLSKKAILNLTVEKEKILKALMENHPGYLNQFLDSKSLRIIINEAIKTQAAKIDTVVTTDVNRLIRTPNTLHAKTGWLTQNIPMERFPEYDPQTSAIAFHEGTEKIYIKQAPQIRIGDETFGPYKEEIVEIPIAVAMFYICKERAMVVR